jgi:hypothetical protein
MMPSRQRLAGIVPELEILDVSKIIHSDGKTWSEKNRQRKMNFSHFCRRLNQHKWSYW